MSAHWKVLGIACAHNLREQRAPVGHVNKAALPPASQTFGLWQREYERGLALKARAALRRIALGLPWPMEKVNGREALGGVRAPAGRARRPCEIAAAMCVVEEDRRLARQRDGRRRARAAAHVQPVRAHPANPHHALDARWVWLHRVYEEADKPSGRHRARNLNGPKGELATATATNGVAFSHMV